MRLIESFAAGCGGRVASTSVRALEPGAAVFYGMRENFVHLFNQVVAERRGFYMIDNSYFDCVRERQFRVTKNAMQCDGLQACWSGEGGDRLKSLGLQIKPWRASGDHVVVCPQSDEYMRLCGWEGDWTADATAVLRRHTNREIRVRRKVDARPLADDLVDAWALVTHTSSAAVEALIAGVPVICTGRCAAQWMGTSDPSWIEKPPTPERRERWAEVLSENQWTEAEMRNGTAWRHLQ